MTFASGLFDIPKAFLRRGPSYSHIYSCMGILACRHHFVCVHFFFFFLELEEMG